MGTGLGALAAPPVPNGIGAALGLLGDEWSLLIVQRSLLGVDRFSQYQTALGIGPTVLSARLAALVDAEVLVKVPDGGRQAYRLTRSGRDLWPLLLCLWAWEQEWVQGEALPTMRHLTCRKVFVPELACASCGSLVERGDVEVALGSAGQMARSVPVGSNRRRSGSGRPDGPGLFPATMALIGSRWSSAVLGAAFLGAQRFSEFEAALGAPPNVVAERLRSFVELGVLDDDYVLTAKGRAFFPSVTMLVLWGERWHGAPDGPALVVTHTDCGRAFQPELHCSGCTGVLALRDLSVEDLP